MQRLLHTLAQYEINGAPLPHAPTNDSEITTIMAVAFSMLGAVALLMLTIGGFRYVMSHGDPQAASRAKGTILYAIVGLIVSISAVAIITFVLGSV